MRTPIGIAILAAAVALTGVAAQAGQAPKRPAASAPSAERHGVAASYRSPTAGPGYSAHARHIADCLATYRGAYDPHTDKVALGGRAARRCGL